MTIENKCFSYFGLSLVSGVLGSILQGYELVSGTDSWFYILEKVLKVLWIPVILTPGGGDPGRSFVTFLAPIFQMLRATGKPYHPRCFTCVVCGKNLDGLVFTVDATNQVHCIEDFHRSASPFCCYSVILTVKSPIYIAPFVKLQRHWKENQME